MFILTITRRGAVNLLARRPFIKLKRRLIHGCVLGLEPGIKKTSFLSSLKKEAKVRR
jgi:hypothetical protein